MKGESQRHIALLCSKTSSETETFDIINSQNDLGQYDIDSVKLWLIDASLIWEKNKSSSFYGFDIAIYLRTVKKSKAPIIIFSPIQQEYFEKKSKTEKKYLILFGRGTLFVETPIKKEEILELAQNVKPLNTASLHDLTTMLCNLRGIVIDRLNHDLKFDSSPSLVDEIFNKIKPYLTSYQQQLIELDNYKGKLKESLKAKEDKSFSTLKQQLISLCNLHLSDTVSINPIKNKVKHKILVVDDNNTDLENIVSNLSDDFDIIKTRNGKEAIHIIQEDTANVIIAVISDWRLYTDEKQNYWQGVQGYELLEYASKTGIRALFALTSQADFVVHHIRNLMGIKFAMFKKENLRIPEQWKVFIDILNEGCEQTIKIRASLPSSANWLKNNNKGKTYKSLKQQYIEKWNSENRESFFNSIYEKADEIWDYLEEEKRKNENYRYVISLKQKFGLELSTSAPKLCPVLIYRVIWLALWYTKLDSNNFFDQSAISDTIHYTYQVMFSGMSDNYKSNNPNVEMNKLCLITKEIQNKKILPEESKWLIDNKVLLK